MPDITMCKNWRCPLRLKCWRYTAFPSEHWQSYFVGLQTPRKNGDEPATCDYFWDNTKKINRFEDEAHEKAYLDSLRKEVKTVLDNL
jgi:hypothetical protein